MDSFSGKLAVITGAGSGIGRSLATRCAQEGMRLALLDRRRDRLDALTAELRRDGTEVIARECDVADAAAVEGFSQECHAAFGAPDLLFNNAGILRVGQTWSHTAEDWQRILSINIIGVVNGLNAFLPLMLERGVPAHIINTGSVGSMLAAPGMAQYTACKMSVRGITESLAYDLAAMQAPIDVSLLCPGPVLTAIGDEVLGIEPGSENPEPAEHAMTGLAGFITADECVGHVFEAIRTRRFWVFTHPFGNHLQQKTQAIVDGENPVYQEVEFDAELSKP